MIESLLAFGFEDLYVFLSYADWDSKLQQTMVEMFPLNSADVAYTKISGMLSTLGDPFTRIISPKVLKLIFFLWLILNLYCDLNWQWHAPLAQKH